jgi:hypothetical protein
LTRLGGHGFHALSRQRTTPRSNGHRPIEGGNGVSSLPSLTAADARRLTDELKAAAASGSPEAVWERLLALYEGGAHIALSYPNWGLYWREEFAKTTPWLGRSSRRGYELLEAARVMRALNDQCEITHRPTADSVARALGPLLEDEEWGATAVAAAWEESVVAYGPEPTAAQVRTVVRRSRLQSSTDRDRPYPDVLSRPLLDEYIVGPFSVLDARSGYWQDRKGRWRALGIRDEVGRGKKLTYGKFKNDPNYRDGSTSKFDPMLAEVMYWWFAPRGGGLVLDPFAGGPARGLVAAFMGHTYFGVELRAEQVEANRAQAQDVLGPSTTAPVPTWLEGDSNVILASGDAVPEKVDLVFSSPPFADLERYSDLPADLSNMSPQDYDTALHSILPGAVTRLKDDRFAVIVMGANVRDRKTHRVRDLVGTTRAAMEGAGAFLHAELAYVTPCGTAPQRAHKQFDTSSTPVGTHQLVLVFGTGDPCRATDAIRRGNE